MNGRRTSAHLERRLRLHLTPFFGARRMAQSTTADVRTFIRDRQEHGASNGEVNRELSVVKRMFSLAVQAQKLHHRPYIPMLQEDNVRTGFFEVDQFTSLLVHLPVELQPVMQFAYITGWRIASEVLTLEWRQVDLTAGTVRLDPGTTNNRDGRLFPLTHDLQTLLDVQRAHTDTVSREIGAIVPLVFHRHGEPIRDFRGAWAKARTAAGCPGRIPHDLSADCGTELRTGRGAAISGDGDGRPQDRIDLPPLCDCRPGDAYRRGAEAVSISRRLERSAVASGPKRTYAIRSRVFGYHTGPSGGSVTDTAVTKSHP